MKTFQKAMVALFVVSTFFACESEEVSPINPSAQRISSGVPDVEDEEFEIYRKEFDRDLSGGEN